VRGRSWCLIIVSPVGDDEGSVDLVVAIRRNRPDKFDSGAESRKPVMQAHGDQTVWAAQRRLRWHLPAEEAEEIIESGSRFQVRSSSTSYSFANYESLDPQPLASDKRTRARTPARPMRLPKRRSER